MKMFLVIILAVLSCQTVAVPLNKHVEENSDFLLKPQADYFNHIDSSLEQDPHTVKEHGPLTLVDNGYDNLLIKISHYVPEEYCNYISTGLKNVLRLFSRHLARFTNGRASLRSATIVIPPTWRADGLTCSMMQPLGAAVSPSIPHITIENRHPIFGSNPMAQQSQSCGKPGDKIRIGYDILRVNSNESHSDTARLLAVEWAKFRWGVFEEKGVPGDPLYPSRYQVPKRQTFEDTLCANGQVMSNGADCDYTKNPCPIEPDQYSNSHIQSSLLSLPELPSVQKFCDNRTHNREALTKQNALCHGLSAWEVIERSVDFADNRNSESDIAKALEPVIRFVKESVPRYVFVIEDTMSMNIQSRWEYLRKAVRKVIVYDIPNNSHIGIVTFNSVAHRVAPLRFIETEFSFERQKVSSRLPRNPSAVPESQKCILCGIQEALRTIEESFLDAAGANIILVTSGASKYMQMNEIIHLIDSRHIRVIPVIYPMGSSSGRSHSYVSHGLEKLSRNGVRSFTVMDEGVGHDSKISMLVAMMNALRSAVKLSGRSDSIGSPVLIHEQEYPGGIAYMSTGTFALDDSLGPNTRFAVHYYDMNHVGNTIQLTSPSGDIVKPIQEEDGDVNMIFVNLEDVQRGLWSYTIENKADSHQGLHVQVYGKRNTSIGLSVNLWTSSPDQVVNGSDTSNPVILYASVMSDDYPILRARVVAKIQRLGMNGTGSTYSPIYVDLLDNGSGDPDITGNDGIYSRYLPPLHAYPGTYFLTAHVDDNGSTALIGKGDGREESSHLKYYQQPQFRTSAPVHCCGSVIKHKTSRAPPFTRIVSWGDLELVESSPLRDILPPSRILDLQVSINESTQTISLVWTSPGDDWDYGAASFYEALIGPSINRARAFQGNKLKGLPKPLEAGKIHYTTLNLHKLEQFRFQKLWYVTIRAVDEVGNIGQVGNIVPLWIARPPTTYEITTRTQPGLTTSSETYGNFTLTSELGSEPPMFFAGMEVDFIAIILGSIIGTLLIGTLIVVYLYIMVVKKRREQPEESQPDNTTNNNGSVNMMADDSCDSQDRRASISSEHKETNGGRPLSPVQSWGATRLLQEHERRLSIHSSGDVIDEKMMVDIPHQYPDVTVTDYPHPLPTPTPSSTSTSNTCSTEPLPAYTQYPPVPIRNPSMNYYPTEYHGYNGNSYDKALTGHLLGHVVGNPNVVNPTSVYNPMGSPMGSPLTNPMDNHSHQSPISQGMKINGNHGSIMTHNAADRKRRNITQV